MKMRGGLLFEDDPAPAGKVVPFGKYKGRAVEELLADRQYCDWLAIQPWFPQRFASIHAVILNYGGEPQDTPAHNRMQTRFLDPAYCRAVYRAAFPDFDEELTSGPVFEADGWDVLYTVNATEIDKTGKSIEHWRDYILIECKPTIGDDFPSILRQIKRRIIANRRLSHGFGSAVVLVDQFYAEGATFEQVREMFSASEVILIFGADVERQLAGLKEKSRER